MQRPHRSALGWSILMLLGLGMLTGCLAPSSSETPAPSPFPPVSETPVAPQPTATLTATSRPSPTPPPTLTPTAEPTGIPTSAAASTPSLLALPGPVVSHNGVSFTLDPALGNEMFVDPASDSLAAVEFSFAEGDCWNVGCVTVYPAALYREEILFGDDIIDSLESAIETQSKGYFPVLMAHILLRAQTRHLYLQNGAGIRAIVIKGQDTVWANNESLMYEFHGLTDDGRYYVVVTFPIDAPVLLSTYDPAENRNGAAIPLPDLPSPADDVQRGAVMREYNQEAQRQLDLLDSSSFAPDLGVLDALVASLRVAPLAEPPSAADGMGALHVDIDYRGTWYRETFSYTRLAENVAHFVLVMPAREVDRATADQILSSIDFSAAPAALSVREGREEFAWALEYVYEAPGGSFRGQFEPGTYYVAGAFVVAPLSREEDAILYAGMTGGGASTDYRPIAVAPGENHVTLSLTDGDGWACPWLYVYDGESFERRTEILRNVRGRENERTEVSPAGLVEIVDGAVTLRVSEEKDEMTFIDELYITVEGIPVHAEPDSNGAIKAAARDWDYLALAGGESCEFRFRLPAAMAGRSWVPVSVVVSGFYTPLEP